MSSASRAQALRSHAWSPLAGASLLLALLLSGCSSTAPAPQAIKAGTSEVQRLKAALNGRQVAVTARYESAYVDGMGRKKTGDVFDTYCDGLKRAAPLEAAVRAWAGPLADEAQLRAQDLKIEQRWVCENMYTTTGGATAVLGLLTLGVAPSESMIRVGVDVEVRRGSQVLFRRSYVEKDSFFRSLIAGGPRAWEEAQLKFALELGNRLVGRFQKDLDRDAALDD